VLADPAELGQRDSHPYENSAGRRTPTPKAAQPSRGQNRMTQPRDSPRPQGAGVYLLFSHEPYRPGSVQEIDTSLVAASPGPWPSAVAGVHAGSGLMGQRTGRRARAASMSGTCSSAQSRTARSGTSRERPSGVRAYSTRGGFSSYA